MDTVISSSGISPSAQPGRSTIESFQLFTESESESESGDSEPELTINNVATQTRFAGVDVCPLPMDDASIQTGEPAWLIHNTTQTTLLRRRGQELEDDAFQSFGHALLHSCNLYSERTGMMLNDPQSSFAEVAPTAPVTGTGTFLTDPTVLEHCLHVRSLLKSVQSAIDADANANGFPMQPVVAQKGIPNKRKKKAASKARKGRTDDDQALEQAFQDNQVVLSGEIAELAYAIESMPCKCPCSEDLPIATVGPDDGKCFECDIAVSGCPVLLCQSCMRSTCKKCSIANLQLCADPCSEFAWHCQHCHKPLGTGQLNCRC